MSIDRLGQYSGWYHSYPVSQIPQVSVEEVKKQDQEQLKQQNAEMSQVAYAQEPQNPASRMANLEDISLNFNVNETYDYIGKDADLQNLDMMSAISDMQKDKVLEQYQYFVGPKDMTGSVIASTPDGMVLQK